MVLTTPASTTQAFTTQSSATQSSATQSSAKPASPITTDVELAAAQATGPERMYRNGDYLHNNADWHADESPWKAQHILTLLQQNQCSFERAVEVGCGAGQILQLLKQSLPKKSFTGYDISPQAAAFWQAVPADKVTYRLEDFLTTQETFDLLLLIDVFEHVPDYLGFLQQLRTRASQFVFHIPLDMNTLMMVKDEHRQLRERIGHIHYFSRDSAIATLEDCGYSVVDWFYTPSYSLPGHERRINPLRKLLFKLKPDLAVNLLGGWSMMVLAEPIDS